RRTQQTAPPAAAGGKLAKMSSLFARRRWAAAHACVAPTIVNNNPETMELTRRPLPTPRGCVRDAGAATLMIGRRFGECAFLEDSRYTSQREICGARGFIRLACGGSRRLRRPLPASGGGGGGTEEAGGLGAAANRERRRWSDI